MPGLSLEFSVCHVSLITPVPKSAQLTSTHICGKTTPLMPQIMHWRIAVRTFQISLLSIFLLMTSARADEPALKPGDHIAIVGDSITEQKLYSVFMEDYLLMCKPTPKLTITQFGWSGETSWGFAARMGNDML